MTRSYIKVPIKRVGNQDWGDLDSLGLAHEICGETVKVRPDLSFSGGHRVRLYYFKKNVHWKIPTGQSLDISDVEPEALPRRRTRS